MHNGACASQQKTCEQVSSAYSSTPWFDCAEEVSVSDAIWWKCYIRWCVQIWRKHSYYSDDLVCSQWKGNWSTNIWPLYHGRYCISPSLWGWGNSTDLVWKYGGPGGNTWADSCPSSNPQWLACDDEGAACVVENCNTWYTRCVYYCSKK